jgi:hypothetical protein
MQLEQALIELDEQNTMNAIVIKRREAKMVMFANAEKPSSAQSEESLAEIEELVRGRSGGGLDLKAQVERQKHKILILKENTKKNISKRQAMKKDLLEAYQFIRTIRNELPEKIKHEDIKNYLELGISFSLSPSNSVIVIKNNFLESQNVQLLLNLQLQSRTISDLKSMIMRQQKFIHEHNLNRTSSQFYTFAFE